MYTHDESPLFLILDNVNKPDACVDREKETARLFESIGDPAYQSQIDEVRETIIRLNMCVAASLARRYANKGESLADLQQVAYFGLTKAVQGFQPEQSRDFLSYAVPTITGEIKRHFRDRCWVIKPPRRIQELQRNISLARQELVQSHIDNPTVEELATKLGENEQSVVDALATRGCFSPKSLDVPISELGSATLGEFIADSVNEVENAENKLLAEELISTLGPEDQEIVILRFYEGYSQREIANHIGSSQMRVSRRLTKILSQLRASLSTESSLLAS